MHILIRWVFLICLLVPLAAHGQKRIYMPSVGYAVIVPSHCRQLTIICGKLAITPQLIILNPVSKRGLHLGYFHRASIWPYTGYSFGIASSGRYHFVGISAGPDISIPGFSTTNDGQATDGWRVGVQGQAGVFVMPLQFLGFGIFLYGQPALNGEPAGWGAGYDLMVRIGWK